MLDIAAVDYHLRYIRGLCILPDTELVTYKGFRIELRDRSGRYTMCSEVTLYDIPITTPSVDLECSAIGDILKYKRTKTTYALTYGFKNP